MTALFPAFRTGLARDDRTRSGIGLPKLLETGANSRENGATDTKMSMNRGLSFPFVSKMARHLVLKIQQGRMNNPTQAFSTDSGYIQHNTLAIK